MDIIRFLALYVFFLNFLLLNIYIIFKLLKEKNRDNLTFSLALFFILGLSAIIINFIYAWIYEIVLISLLHRISFICATYCFYFILNFNLVLLKTKIYFNIKKQISLGLTYFFIIFAFFFTTNDIKLDKSTDWKPEWDYSFTITYIIFSTIILLIPILITTHRIYIHLSLKELKKKIKIFSIGVIGYFSYLYTISLYNSTNNILLRIIYTFYMVSIFLYAYLIYKGSIKSLK